MSKFEVRIAENAADVGEKAVGSTFWRSTTVVSTTIVETAVDITGASLEGELVIEDIILKTDQTTGLAGGTTLKIQSTNAKGTVTVMREQISKLGAGITLAPMTKTEDDASLTNTKHNVNPPHVLELGKKLQVRNVGGAGSGAGTVDIYFKFRRLTKNANVVILN